MNDPMRLLPRAVHFPFCRNRSYLFHKAIIKGSVDRVNAVGVNVKKHGTNDKRKATAFRQSLLGYAVCFWLFPQGKVTTK